MTPSRAQIVGPALAALAGAAVVLLPALWEAGDSRLLGVALLALTVGALVGTGASMVAARRRGRRLDRLSDSAALLGSGEPVPYLAPERDDEIGRLESRFGHATRAVAETIGELRREQERMRAILSGMVEGVVVTDPATRVVLLNDRARELLDVSDDGDALGRALVELVRAPALQELGRVLRSGAPVVSRDVALEVDGGRVLQVNAARLSGPTGASMGFVLVLHDATELRRLEVIRRDFVANVSHELRTPLTAIKGYAETLLGPAGDDRETAKRFLAIIDRHSERLGRLTDDLLTLSDLELGRAALRLGVIEVGPAIDDVLQILTERAARAEVRLVAEVPAATPAIAADGDRLRQVLINLVDNAIKFTPAGGRVAVRAGPRSTEADLVEITITDTGIGIPTEDLPRLTERFFRVDKARSRALGGTGLGLAIVKHIVQAHGGSLDITSAVGQGTTVHVVLPACPEPLVR